MEQLEVEGLIKDLNSRTKRIQQILPTLATKEDLKAYATKEEMREEGERTRRHFDVVAEGLKESIKLIADGYKAIDDRITAVGQDIRSVLDNHERRITKLETQESKRPKRR